MIQGTVVETEKNLHASIPPALLAEAEKIAAARHVSMDELMKQAVQSFVEERSWKEAFAFGKQQAQRLGYKEEDVDRLIHEFREEDRAGKFHDSGRFLKLDMPCFRSRQSSKEAEWSSSRTSWGSDNASNAQPS
jgi:hypothetical protein